MFFGIGLYAESNALVAALAFGGLSIAFAIFLILEFGMPYTGLFRVTPARARADNRVHGQIDWLAPYVVAKLKFLRGARESYRDVILHLASGVDRGA